MSGRRFAKGCAGFAIMLLVAIMIAAVIIMEDMILNQKSQEWWLFPLLGGLWLCSFPLLFAGKRG